MFSNLEHRQVLVPLIAVMAVITAMAISRAQTEEQLQERSRPEMVLIPGGQFLMGIDGDGDNSPVHTVFIDSFYIGKYEVTNAQYAEFCRKTEREMPEFWDMDEFHGGPEYAEYPVIGVSWGDANAYAEWSGMRLPTEAEWEYAGRGGLVGQNYTYGDEPDSSKANFKSEGTVPVGSYPANGFGLHDMSGNVVEWVADYYDQDYYSSSSQKNPAGPTDGKFKVIRGGGWYSGPYCNRVHFRNALPGQWVDFNVGFRCAKDLRGPSAANEDTSEK
ncbi:MAG: formylglycine-generating enzyme family protein [Candidatus Zixiibacteriota bacterium]